MTTTTIHGGIPEGIRDRDGVFGEKQEPGPQSRLATARATVARLRREHAEAQSTLRVAIDDDGGTYDFNALKSNVHRLARELAEAEEEVTQWESVTAQLEKANRERRFHEALKEAREARAKFAELYRDACLQLGRWYSLGSEIRDLTNDLPDKLPDGSRYYQPELKNALVEVAEDPNPLHQLLDGGFVELQTAQSWRRHCAVVPLVPKQNVGKEK